MKVAITHVDATAADMPFPQYATEGSAGMDLHASVAADAPMTIEAGKVALVPTGLGIALPQGVEAQVRSRSGLAAKKGIFALNAPGTIDSDYRGEIKVILANFGSEPFIIQRGDRIAQMVIARYEQVEWNQVESLDETDRGDGGFGSTGVKA